MEPASDPTQSAFLCPASSDLASRIEFVSARGRTALLDAVYLGSQIVRTGRNPRKVLFVISDGGENSSRYTEGEIRESLAQTRVRVYTVATTGSESGAPELAFLRRLADEARGRFAAVDRSSDLATVVRELSMAISTGQ